MAKDTKDDDPKKTKIVEPDEADPEPRHGGGWFWGGDPPPEHQPLTVKSKA